MSRKDAVERAFGLHDGFESDGAEYVVTTTPFEGRVAVDDTQRVEVTVQMPTLSAVVTGESVADVVESGWFETLELRLEDAHTVVSTDDATPPSVERDGDGVTLSVGFAGTDKAADDAKAIVDFAEGTWMQGIVPGYEYGEPAAGMLNRAHQEYE